MLKVSSQGTLSGQVELNSVGKMDSYGLLLCGDGLLFRGKGQCKVGQFINSKDWTLINKFVLY